MTRARDLADIASSGVIETAEIADNAITSAKIGVDVIVAEDLAANSITVSEITNNAVTLDKIKITGETQLSSAPATGDELIIFDASASANKRINFANFTQNIGGAADDYFASSGLSAKDLGVGLHIKTGDSGASVNSDADQLVIESNSGSVGMSILSATNGTGDIYFGDSGNNAAGFIQYNHSDNYMRFGTNAATERMRIESGGNIGIGTTNASGKVHIMKADSGALVDANADELFLENTSATGLTIGSSTNGEGAIQFSDSGDSDVGKIQYTHSDNTMTFRTNGSNRMTINSSGTVRVGSNTTSPNSNASDVVVEGSGNTGISILSGGSNSASLYLGTNGANNDGLVAYDNDNNDLYFHANASQKFRINSNGDVQIGMQSWGNAPSASNFGIEFNNTNFGSSLFGSGTGTNNHFTFGNPNGACGGIATSGSNTSFNTSSDYRLKENQVAISDGITRLKTLKPYRFNFKTDADKTVDGFFAHEVSSVVPEAITGDKDAMAKVYYEKGNTIPEDKKVGDFKEYSTSEISPQAIDQSKLVPLLTSALQEAITKIETLEARVQTLENA